MGEQPLNVSCGPRNGLGRSKKTLWASPRPLWQVSWTVGNGFPRRPRARDL